MKDAPWDPRGVFEILGDLVEGGLEEVLGNHWLHELSSLNSLQRVI